MLKGTAIKILSTVSDTADSVTIDIYNPKPDGTLLVDNANMVNEGGNLWSFSYQMPNVSGRYTAIIKATANGLTVKDKLDITLDDY